MGGTFGHGVGETDDAGDHTLLVEHDGLRTAVVPLCVVDFAVSGLVYHIEVFDVLRTASYEIQLEGIAGEVIGSAIGEGHLLFQSHFGPAHIERMGGSVGWEQKRNTVFAGRIVCHFAETS